MTTTTNRFAYYVEPEAIASDGALGISIGAGSVDGDEPGRSTIELNIDGSNHRLSPSDAARLGEALTRHGRIDEVMGPEYSPRAGQTFPASSPLDTLKHLALRVQALCESAVGAMEAMEIDELSDNGSWLGGAIDDIIRETKLAIGEHIEGINPDAISTDTRTGEGYSIEGWAPAGLWAREVNRYDSGAPIRLQVEDGGTSHTVWTRLSPDPRGEARS